jgi:hypothetical protein
MLTNGPLEGSASHNREFILDDKFGANLWDIEPLCQVASVCKGRAVILDGPRGATIHWDKIPRLTYTRRKATGRQTTEFVLRAGPVLLLVGIIVVGIGTGETKAPRCNYTVSWAGIDPCLSVDHPEIPRR